MRLTKDVRKQLLKLNDGLIIKTDYSSRNFSESRVYKIIDGKLLIRSVGKTSWADSRFDDWWEADDEEIHRFLYKNLDRLNKGNL